MEYIQSRHPWPNFKQQKLNRRLLQVHKTWLNYYEAIRHQIRLQLNYCTRCSTYRCTALWWEHSSSIIFCISAAIIIEYLFPHAVTTTLLDYWRLLEITGDYLRLLEITWDYLRLLEITGDYWRLLQRTRECTELHSLVWEHTHTSLHTHLMSSAALQSTWVLSVHTDVFTQRKKFWS